MAEFFHMGGYASFVWPAWGITAAAIIAVSLRSIIRARAIKYRLNAAEGKSR